MSTCVALCMAKNFSLGALREALSAEYRIGSYRDVLHLKAGTGDVFIFSYGVLVAWAVEDDALGKILEDIRPYEQDPFIERISDEFTFSMSGRSGIRDDHISLSSDDVLEKLAVSHGIAQSVKLEEFELSAERTIAETAYIPINIAGTGRTRLSRRQLSMMRGSLYLVQSDINLRYNLLETPEFFWENPEVEQPYEMMARYLDVKLRIEILNKKLEVIHELFSILAAEQYHKHSATLEWIIILLIAVEIFFFLIHDIFQIF